MTTIPDEIMQQAIATARAYNRDWENGVDIIAAALLAERLAAEKRGREEAAIAAESYGADLLQISAMGLPVSPSPIIARDRANVARKIAATIRSGS